MNKPKKPRRLSELELEKEKIKLRIKQQEYEIKKNLLDLKSEYHPVSLLGSLVEKVRNSTALSSPTTQQPTPPNADNNETIIGNIKHYIQVAQNTIKTLTEKVTPNIKNEPTNEPTKKYPATFTIGKDDNTPIPNANNTELNRENTQNDITTPDTPTKTPYIIQKKDNEPPVIL